MFPQALVDIFDRALYDGIVKKYSWDVCLQQKGGPLLNFLGCCIGVFLCIQKLKASVVRRSDSGSGWSMSCAGRHLAQKEKLSVQMFFRKTMPTF